MTFLQHKVQLSDKYISGWNIELWGLGWPRLCFSFVEHVFELKLVHDKCQDYCWGRDWQWGASDASRPSRINPNQTRIKLEKTNSRQTVSAVVGEIEVGTAHICLFPPTPDVTCTVCSEWPGLSPGPELGGWRVLYSVIPQSMHNPETVFWDTPGIMCLWVPQLLNATLSSFLLKF